MKEIILMRHAKSDWSLGETSDFERELNQRGRNAAFKMGAKIAELKIMPDMILASAATRVKQTTELFVEGSSFEGKIKFVKEIYTATHFELFKKLQYTDNKVYRIMIIGHNPTLEDLATKLIANSQQKIEMSTSTVVLIQSEALNWADLALNSCKLIHYITPKDIV